MSPTAYQLPLKMKAITAAADPVAQRWHSPSHPLHWCHFSGISRATRRTKMSIQWIAPLFPPAISAEVLQNLHKL